MICLSLISCKPSDSTPPDPIGTITMNLNNSMPLVLYEGANLDITDANYMVGYHFVKIELGIDVTSVTAGVNSILSLTNDNFNGYIYTDEGEISDLSAVNGLGNVIEKPTTGYAYNCAFIKGHGYVVRWKNSDSYNNSTLQYIYGRFYVFAFQTNVLGEISGVNIKYQGPF